MIIVLINLMLGSKWRYLLTVQLLKKEEEVFYIFVLSQPYSTLRVIFHFVKNTAVNLRLELETTSTAVPRLNDCAVLSSTVSK